ncbi:MAG: trigger factor [Acidobacteria bacterium]|nr:trigger factor [Acidobacteriota bacterium]
MSESCFRAIEITVPVEEVDRETERVVAALQKKVRIPGFRPGKVPATMIRARYAKDIREDVLESLAPKHFTRRAEAENLRVVGSPKMKDVHFEAGEPLKFTVECEVAPVFELGEYNNLTVHYDEPQVGDEDVAARLEQLRDEKADYINIDPRPVADGDFAVVSLKSLAGIEDPPIEQDEIQFHVGGESTLPEFAENLRGASPGDEKEIEVSYPADYGQERLAGKKVRFHVGLKAIRRKELPELNDDFAKDLGDYQNLEELREEVRRAIYREREFLAKQESKNEIVDKLVEMHPFPVPETFVDGQIESYAQQYLATFTARGIDPRTINIDWAKLKESQQDRAVREVRASMILDRIAEREAIAAMTDEVDRELHRIARQEREAVAAVRMRLEKDGTLRRIANRIRTEKTLNFLFDTARKEAKE